MKKVVVSVLSAAILMFGSHAFAEKKQCDGHKKRMANKLEHMAELLELTDVQKAEVEAIKAKYKVERKKEKGDGLRKQMKTLDPGAADYAVQVELTAEKAAEKAKERVLRRSQMKAEIYAVLTDEQRQTLEEHKATHVKPREKLSNTLNLAPTTNSYQTRTRPKGAFFYVFATLN